MPPSAHPSTLLAPSQSLFSAHQPGAKSNACSSGPCWPADDAPSPWPCDTRGRAIPPSFSLYHQVFNRARWSAPGSSPEQALKGSRCLLALLVQTFDAAGGSLTFISDILRRLKPTASNMEVQRLQLPRRASWPVVSLLRPGVTPGTPEEHVPLAARLRAALRSA